MNTNDAWIASHLARVASKGHEVRYCIVGAGHGGVCMAGHLGLLGHQVRMYNRTDSHLEGIRYQGGVSLSGAVEGYGPVEVATSDMATALSGADVVMVVTPSTAHASLAKLMAPHLEDGQVVMLNPGRTGGALQVSAVLRGMRPDLRVVIGEAQTFLYASRSLGGAHGRIYKVKQSVPIATLPSCWIPPVLEILNSPFPGFSAGGNVLATSLENIGAVFHPALTLLNAGWIESTQGDFEYYLQGITPSVAAVLERVDAERMAITRALGLQSVTAREWLYRSYGSAGDNLCEAIRATGAYAGIKAPTTTDHRYVWEDIPMSLVPMASLATMLGLRTPAIDLVIAMGELMHRKPYREQGRTVEHMGIAGLSVRQLQQFVAGVEPGQGSQKEVIS